MKAANERDAPGSGEGNNYDLSGTRVMRMTKASMTFPAGSE